MTKKRKVTLGILATLATVAIPIVMVTSCRGRYGDGDVFYVSNGGSINDQSFNQQGANATAQILNKSKLEPSDYYEPKKSDTATISQGFAAALNANKKIVIGTGFYHITAISQWVKMQGGPLKFIIADIPGSIPSFEGNVAGIEYKTKESGFMAGYLASQYLIDVKKDTTPTVATFGGASFPAVTNFMVGFVMGVKYFNETKKPTNLVKFAGFSQAVDYTNSGFIAGGGISKATALVSKGADIILPVAGPQTVDVLSAIKNKDALIIGVDTDQKLRYSNSDSEKFLTSITKNIQGSILAVYNKVTGKKAPNWAKGYGETTIGNLANDMTGLAKPGMQDAFGIYGKINKDATLKTKAEALVEKITWDSAMKYIEKNKR